MIPPVVDAGWLSAHPEAAVADVRWYLDGRSGADAYAGGHLPGAVWIDLNAVLAGPPTAADGRHPLPAPEAFAAGLGAAGIGDDTVVVAYDDAGGMAAGRLVWLLRTLGHDAALLDGGLASWTGPLVTEPTVVAEAHFTPRPWPAGALATIDDAASGPLVLDARAPERYRGETEPIDPRAGHIPGARNAFFAASLDAGRFRTPGELRQRFAALGVVDAVDTIAYCGSGVTACHILIAMERAGLGRGRLYPGSWSQYAATDRPAATGAEPGERRPRPGED